MSDKIFDKDITYRAKVRVKAGTDEIIVRPEAQGKPAKKDVVERGESQMYTTTGKRNPKRVIYQKDGRWRTIPQNSRLILIQNRSRSKR